MSTKKAATYDRRVARTKRNLQEQLVKLMMDKPMNKITVKELCQAADIHRSTFYLHFTDIYDMISQFEEETYNNFRKTLTKYMSKEGDLLKAPAQNRTPVKNTELLLETFHFIKDNPHIEQIFIRNRQESNFIKALYNVGKDSFMEQALISYPGKERYLSYYYDFVASGCVGIMESWIESGMKESVEEISNLAQEFILFGSVKLEESLEHEKSRD